MSLGNYFKQLLAQKKVKTIKLVQDNAAITRDARSATLYNKRATERQTKERPTLAKSVLNADPVAPKLPQRHQSQDELNKRSVQSAGSCAAPRLPLRQKSREILSNAKRSLRRKGAGSCTAPSLPLRQKSRDKAVHLEPVAEEKRCQNAVFGSPRTVTSSVLDKGSASVFASFCEDTRGILTHQLPSSRLTI